MDGLITFERERIVHLDAGTYHWVSSKYFRIGTDRPDDDLLTALVHHPQYRDHYAGGSPDQQGAHNLHGPYQLHRISAESFHRISADTAQTQLHQWADQASGTISAAVQDSLDRWVYPMLATDDVFELRDPGPDAVHDWGWVVGAANGFHEFIAIDRTDRLMTLIVAADD
ncbi:hypothetical protein ACFYO1_01960 [Nocardia sp. NPDC006044]|uniref:hypothetical protein n=1 Tax=Nocardia sp. NPDC006044 TaxID=3364306 RepID=UPI0036A78640